MKIWRDEDTGLEWLYDATLISAWYELEGNLEDVIHDWRNQGWQIPRIRDVMTLIDYTKSNLAIKNFCPLKIESAWCRDEYSSNSETTAWCVSFLDGHIYPSSKANGKFTLFVR